MPARETLSEYRDARRKASEPTGASSVALFPIGDTFPAVKAVKL